MQIIKGTPTSNVMEALQGKIAGADIMMGSGAVGEDVDILLRGSRSINGSNEPLFVIDHRDAYTFNTYCQELNYLVETAKAAQSYDRSSKWKKYFEFKRKYLLLCDVRDTLGHITVVDIDGYCVQVKDSRVYLCFETGIQGVHGTDLTFLQSS
jgi:hypothetical protein